MEDYLELIAPIILVAVVIIPLFRYARYLKKEYNRLEELERIEGKRKID
jgi:hypothetical protein